MQDYSEILNARGWAFLATLHPPLETTEPDYHARVEAALDLVCRSSSPAGMIPWLEKAEPGLYDDLTRRLPDLIDRLWNAHAAIEEFQHVLDSWFAAHHWAYQLYRDHK